VVVAFVTASFIVAALATERTLSRSGWAVALPVMLIANLFAWTQLGREASAGQPAIGASRVPSAEAARSLKQFAMWHANRLSKTGDVPDGTRADCTPEPSNPEGAIARVSCDLSPRFPVVFTRFADSMDTDRYFGRLSRVGRLLASRPGDCWTTATGWAHYGAGEIEQIGEFALRYVVVDQRTAEVRLTYVYDHDQIVAQTWSPPEQAADLCAAWRKQSELTADGPSPVEG